MNRVKIMYEDLLSSGELLDIFPELKVKGQQNSWELDKVKFTTLYKQINDAPNLYIDFEEL